MRVLASLLGVSVFLGMAAPAFADPTGFYLAGTLADGGTLTGAISVSDGYFNPTGILVQDAGITYPFQGSFYEGVDMRGGMPYGLYSVSYQEGAELLLAFPIPTLTGFDGGPLCSTTVDCSPRFTSSFSPLEGGPAIDFVTLTASTTPEPGSWVLLATGLAALAAVRWRRPVAEHSC